MGSASGPKPSIVTGYPAPPGGAAYLGPRPGDAAAYPVPPPGSAYPYPAPPPYAAYYSAPSRSSPLLRRLVAIAVGIFLFIGAATLIVWIVLRPRIPEYSVTSAAVSGFNLSNNDLSANFNLVFSIRNPNKKMSVHYEQLTAAVLYDPDTIADTALAPLYQAKEEVSVVRARLAAAEEYVGDEAVRRIAAERDAGGNGVGFQVRVYGWVTFRAGAWRTRRHVIRVFCPDINIGLKNSTAGGGSLIGPPKPCRVSL